MVEDPSRMKLKNGNEILEMKDYNGKVRGYITYEQFQKEIVATKNNPFKIIKNTKEKMVLEFNDEIM